MSIMSRLEFNQGLDCMEGYEDLSPIGRSNRLAKYALVFLIRGLYCKWKLPVSYYLSHSGVTAQNLAAIIDSVISTLFNNGLIIKAIVCDQSSTNQSFMKHKNIFPERPYFYSGNKKVYAIYDTPHLIKSLRNNLLKGDFMLASKAISFKDIKDVYTIDKASLKSRTLTKITDSHIAPNSFQKMSVKLAVQIFSHTVAATIRSCISTKQLQSNSARNTAEFIEFINNLFDVLNSRSEKIAIHIDVRFQKKIP